MDRVVWRLAMAAWVGVFASMVGCNRAKPAADESPSANQAPSAESPRPSVDDANYHVGLALDGNCRHEKPCQVHAVVVAKGDYHINDKYPYRFTADDSAGRGLSFAKREVGRDDGVFEHMKALLKVPFTAEKAGDTKVGGTLSFSVCSATNCLMYKQPLALLVRVD